MKSIDLSFISRYRAIFMGLAIFWIFFYHTGIDIPGLREIFALGWFGVDIFFFVSGFGLCASLTKNDSIKQYYKRRFSRIIPTWWLILILMAIVGVIFELKGFPISISDYFYWFTGLGWWTGNCNFEWYIPTIIVFYLFAPLLAKASLKCLSMVTLCTMVCAILLRGGHLYLLEHLYMSYSRVPIYISGFMAYKFWKFNSVLPSKIWLPLMISGLVFFSIGMIVKFSNLTFGLTIARVSIPLFIIPFLWLIGFLVEKVKFADIIFSFLGTISLEVYLLHINHEFTSTINDNMLYLLPYGLAKAIWFVMVVVSGWALHKCIKACSQLNLSERIDFHKS